jgi:hypothetical protein
MELVKLIISMKINQLAVKSLALFVMVLSAFSTVNAQDNSPYSRYGIGDLMPNTNITTRGMGGISAGFIDLISVNLNNPASYSQFKTFLEEKTLKSMSGRVVLDIGTNFDNRTLKSTTGPEKFTSSNAIFSYMQMGIPIKNNIGMSFGLRPISRIGYHITRRERLFDPMTNKPIDSALTEFKGDGGSYLASTGAGFAIKNLSVGFNVGYLFGNKNYSTKRALLNDSVEYKNSNHSTKTNYGNVHLNFGAQYNIAIKKNRSIRLGAYGALQQKLNASTDMISETFVRNITAGDLTLDSVSYQKDVKGDIILPSNLGVGFVYERLQDKDSPGYLFGVDFVQTKWENYRYYGNRDQVTDSWQLRFGGQLRPIPSRNYWSNVAYRAGFFFGPDYVKVQKSLSQYGITLGLELPLINYNRLSPGQYTRLNLAFEYINRGNNDNLLKDNNFRISAGFNLSDIWFGKKKYD